ncbi:ATP/GTP-binding protein [Kitasatospora sp. GAS204B]|uniref:ATP/GTP-binding protein n=1 Tax=unclassified Kitasatospora TaxID=2633591 RepID=UPI0024759AC6|nr:ATP/GTP-binding protein [Kitasatospora sp. GAS204B]
MHGDQQVPCSDPRWGWYNPADGCYWALITPQPADTDPVWVYATGAPATHKPGDGQLYNVSCPWPGMELMGGTTFSATPPPGFGGAVDPAALASQMTTQMGLLGADIGTAPRKGGTSLVGLPVWLWNNVSDSTWGPKTASANAPGITVTATAHVDRIIWSTGDGASVTCTGPGVKYAPAFGTQQPDCGHTYTQPGTYTITATSKWIVSWTATTGQSGQIPVDRVSTATVQIAEAQAVNTQ